MSSNIYELQSGEVITPEPLPTVSQRRQRRIWRVLEMYQQGMRTREIAQFLSLSQRSVQKDIIDARRLARAFVQNFDGMEALGREIRFLEATRRTAMRLSQVSHQEAVRLGYLRTALDAASRLIALLQSTGLIRQVPQHVEITSNPFEDAALRRRVMGMLLEVRRHGGRISGIDY